MSVQAYAVVSYDKNGMVAFTINSKGYPVFNHQVESMRLDEAQAIAVHANCGVSERYIAYVVRVKS